MKQLRTFYNPDCMMYGVEQLIDDYTLYVNGKPTTPKKWVQILPPNGKGARNGKSAYTRYEAVAKRWIAEIQAQR